MSKRKYTKLKAIEPEIIAMREAGKTRREIAEHFGLEVRQIVWWVSRYNKSQAKLKNGELPKKRGRASQKSENKDEELKRLRMENKLLRDFLQLSERM